MRHLFAISSSNLEIRLGEDKQVVCIDKGKYNEKEITFILFMLSLLRQQWLERHPQQERRSQSWEPLQAEKQLE
jgi:hypothetical protein